jgi:hypothetical protein
MCLGPHDGFRLTFSSVHIRALSDNAVFAPKADGGAKQSIDGHRKRFRTAGIWIQFSKINEKVKRQYGDDENFLAIHEPMSLESFGRPKTVRPVVTKCPSRPYPRTLVQKRLEMRSVHWRSVGTIRPASGRNSRLPPANRTNQNCPDIGTKIRGQPGPPSEEQGSSRFHQPFRRDRKGQERVQFQIVRRNILSPDISYTQTIKQNRPGPGAHLA